MALEGENFNLLGIWHRQRMENEPFTALKIVGLAAMPSVSVSSDLSRKPGNRTTWLQQP